MSYVITFDICEVRIMSYYMSLTYDVWKSVLWPFEGALLLYSFFCNKKWFFILALFSPNVQKVKACPTGKRYQKIGSITKYDWESKSCTSLYAVA